MATAKDDCRAVLAELDARKTEIETLRAVVGALRSVRADAQSERPKEGKRNRTSKIKLRIPAGVDTGSRLRSSGNGEAGFRGGPPGDLYVMLHVKEHEIFQRDGDDLLCDVPVSFVQAALGAEIVVPTLEGTATIRIPAGTQPATTFRVKARGLKNLQGYGLGDLRVRIQVEVPTRLNAAQKEKLAEFSALCDGKEAPLISGFFEKAKKFFK